MSKFDTHGGYFAPKDYLRVNEGGSHEENPNGGVQIGVDPEGNPNLLEEGEPVYKDYVYSDNIEAEEQFLVDNNLPKRYTGKLYSKIADDLFSEAEERPLDPISHNGLDVLLGRLADAQEGQKLAKEQRDLEDELANLSPEELEQLEDMLAQGEQEQIVPEQVPMEAVPEEQVVSPSEPMPVEGTPMMANGGTLHAFAGGGPKKSMADEIASEILAQANSGSRASGIGNTDLPLVSEHPELDVALMAAQPGSILTKTMAPSAYRGIVEGLANGEGSQTLLYAMSPGAKTKVVEAAMEKAYAPKASLKSLTDKIPGGVKTASRIGLDILAPEVGLPAEAWMAAKNRGVPLLGRVGIALPAAAVGRGIGYLERNATTAVGNHFRNSKSATYSEFDPANTSTSDNSGQYAEPYENGGKVNKFVRGGYEIPFNYGSLRSLPMMLGTSDIVPPVFTTRNDIFSPGALYSRATLDPAYVFADRPSSPSLRGLATSNQDGLHGAFAINDDNHSSEALAPSYVYASGPSGYNFPNQVTNTRPDGLKLSPHPISDLNVSSAGDEDVVSSEVSEGAGSSSLLPTWPRYAGAIGSGLLGLYNVFQQPDRYTAPHINPQLPEGRINLQNQVYNPIDQNMVVNAQIAQGNATNRALRNSGIGPSTGAAILAADNNLTGNLGAGFIQAWDANNQRRNAVIAANNQAEAQRAQFDYTVDAARKDAINRLAPYNAQNDLMVQRLNNQAEAEKYQAISNQISNGLQALSGIGQENFAMNQINTNPAFLGYGVGVNGGMYYNPRTGRYERIEPMSQPATTEVTTTVQPQAPLLRHYPRDYQLELLQNPTLYPGYDMTLNGLKKKNR